MKTFLIVAAAVVIVAGLGMVIKWAGMAGRHGDWFVHVEAESLVHFSDHIVIARYVDETVYELPDTLTAGETSWPSSLDVYRRFEVVETLKGSFGPGDVAYVAWNVRNYDKRQDNGDPEFIPWEEISLSLGENYVLFLTPRYARRPPTVDVRIRDWRTPEGLEVAQADSQGRLAFQTTRFYQNALKDMGLKPIEGTGGAPFALTVAEIRSLVASQASDPG